MRRGVTAVLMTTVVGGCSLPAEDDAVPVGESADEIVNGSLVTGTNPVYENVNRSVVGLDAIKLGPQGSSQGTGILVGPRLVLTASHVGQDGNCGIAGQSVEFGVDSIQEDEQVAVVGEIDFASSCSSVGTPGCCDRGDNNIDVGLWVLEHPPAVAAPYWRPRSNVALGEAVQRFGFGPGNDAGKLRFTACTVSNFSSDSFNGARFETNNCMNGATSEGGDSGGPMLDLDDRIVGIHIGSYNGGDPAIAMHLAAGYVSFVEYYLAQFRTKLVIADIDGDGLRDFVHWNGNNRGNWIDLNDGPWPDGGGEPGSGFNWCAQELHTGDFNGDGRDDLMCHNAAGQKLYFRYGTSGGGFTSGTTRTSSWCANEILVGDFDGDDFDDLLCREQGTQRKIKLNSQGSNPFPGGGSDWSENFGWCGQELYVADFDNDSRADVLCRNPGTALYVRHGTSGGGLGATTSLATPWCGQKLLVADFSGDGRDDLMCLDQVGDRVWIDYASSATFPFSGQTDWGNLAYPFCGQDAHAADVDGDGKAEVVCHDPSSGIIWVDKTTVAFGGFDGVPDAKRPNITTPKWP